MTDMSQYIPELESILEQLKQDKALHANQRTWEERVYALFMTIQYLKEKYTDKVVIK